MQEETLKIVEPLVTYMEQSEGWWVEKTHGNQYQEGFPDLLCFHRKYSQKWIECKVVRKGTIEFTNAQEKKFPKWIMNGARIWLIAGVDFRGAAGLPALKRAYALLFNEPNLSHYLLPKNRRMLLST